MSTSLHSATRSSRIASALLSGLAVLAALGLGASLAVAYPAKVKSACKSDYKQFCPQYGEDSSQLKSCMRAAGGKISCRCRNALADTGYIARKYHCGKPGI